MNHSGIREPIERVETLLHRFDASHDESVKADAADLISSLMDLHSTCLERIISALQAHGEIGQQILAQLVADESVSGLLLLYDLHPVSLSDRVRAEIEKVQSVLQSHQAAVEVVSVDEDHARLRLVVQGGGCHSNGGSLKQLVEDAVVSVAPNLNRIEIEEMNGPAIPKLVTLQGLAKYKNGQMSSSNSPDNIVVARPSFSG